MQGSLDSKMALIIQALDCLPFKFYIVDKDLNIVVWNKKGEEGPYGVKPDDAVGRPLCEVLRLNVGIAASPKDVELIAREFAEIFEKGAAFCTEEVSNLLNGEKRYYRVTKTPLRVEGGGVSHVSTIVEDITEQRRIESILIARQRLFSLENMAAGIAHQINNPLSTMMVCVESLLKETRRGALKNSEDASRFERYLETTCRQIGRCNDVANMLMKFGKTNVEARAKTDINKVIEETVNIMKSGKRLAEFKVDMALTPGLPTVTANESLLKEVFATLIENSYEANSSKNGGTLRISTSIAENDPPVVSIRFADNGCGMDTELASKIFMPFFTTKGSARAGLGLAVAHSILSEHGGRIDVESAVGKGSVFTVTLPANHAAPQGARTARHSTCHS